MEKKGPRTLRDREVYLAPSQAYFHGPLVQSLLPLFIDNIGLKMAKLFIEGFPDLEARFSTDFDHSLFVIFHWRIGAFSVVTAFACAPAIE